jgi:hypothetical protein
MADKQIKVKIDVETNTEGSIAELKALKKQLKETAAGSEEFKKIFNQIDDLEDKIKSAKGASADWIDTLESAGGPIGALGGALNKAKVATISFGAALKAAGIGLIVAAVGGLVAAFNNVEGAGKKLEPLLIGFEKILGGIFEALTPLIDAFVELATQALPYITTGIKVFYSSLVSLFTLVKEGGAGIGKILKGIFTLDTKSIEEGFNQLKGSWSKTVDSYNATSERFEAGTKKLTKTQKENLKEQNDNAQKALDEKIKLLEAEDKLDEAKLNKLKAEALQLEQTEQGKLDVEKKFAKLSYDARIKDIEDKQKLYDKDSIEYKNLQTEKIAAEGEYITKTTEFAENQKKIDEDALKSKEDFAEKEKQLQIATIKDATDRAIAERQSKYDKDLADLEKDKEFIKKSEEEKNVIRKNLLTASENDINKIKVEAQLKQAAIEKGDYDARYARLAAGAQFDLELQRSLLEQKKTADDEYYASQLANENLTAEQIRELNDRKLSDQIFYTEKSNQIERDRIAVKQKALDDIISIVGAESDIGRAALIAKQILAAKELILEVTRTITFSAQAAARSTVAVAEGVAQTAKVGFPQNIPLLIGYAAQAVGIIMAIKSAVNSAKASATGNGSNMPSISAPPAPTYGGTPTIATPQIQTTGGMNPTTQLGQTITGAQRPIKAYVVSGEISSQQALDRRTSRAATFSAG